MNELAVAIAAFHSISNARQLGRAVTGSVPPEFARYFRFSFLLRSSINRGGGGGFARYREGKQEGGPSTGLRLDLDFTPVLAHYPPA